MDVVITRLGRLKALLLLGLEDWAVQAASSGLREGRVLRLGWNGGAADMAEELSFRKESVVRLGTIDGDVLVDRCRRIAPEKGGEVVIRGLLTVRGDVEVGGSLRCHRLENPTRGEMRILGDLEVKSSVAAGRGRLVVSGSASADRFDLGKGLRVGGDLICGGAHAGGSISVGGNVKADRLLAGGSIGIGGNVAASQLGAGGSVGVEGRIEAGKLDVGGAAKCGHGSVDRVDVGGAFKATGPIRIGVLDVGGAATVGAGSKIDSINVGGAFKATGSLTFKEMKVGGAANVEGDAEGDSADVGGVLKVAGSLTLSEDLEVGGAVSVGKALKSGRSIRVGGVLRAGIQIECPDISVGKTVEAPHVRAVKRFRIGRRGQVRGFIEGGDITIEEKARGETFYGDTIRVEEGARVKNLYGRCIYIERNATVEGVILYTESCEVERGARLREEPRRVDTLPALSELL